MMCTATKQTHLRKLTSTISASNSELDSVCGFHAWRPIKCPTTRTAARRYRTVSSAGLNMVCWCRLASISPVKIGRRCHTIAAKKISLTYTRSPFVFCSCSSMLASYESCIKLRFFSQFYVFLCTTTLDKNCSPSVADVSVRAEFELTPFSL